MHFVVLCIEFNRRNAIHMMYAIQVIAIVSMSCKIIQILQGLEFLKLQMSAPCENMMA